MHLTVMDVDENSDNVIVIRLNSGWRTFHSSDIKIFAGSDIVAIKYPLKSVSIE